MTEYYLIFINLILLAFVLFQNLRQNRQIRELTDKLIERER